MQPSGVHRRRRRPTLHGHQSHPNLEDRLLDQAQARASYTPPFWGVIRIAYPLVSHGIRQGTLPSFNEWSIIGKMHGSFRNPWKVLHQNWPPKRNQYWRQYSNHFPTELPWNAGKKFQGMIFDVQPLVKSLFCPIRQPPMDFLILRPLPLENWTSLLWGGGQKFVLRRLQAVGRSSGPIIMQPTADLEVGGSSPGYPPAAPAPQSADGGSNRRPPRLRSAALPRDRYAFCSSCSPNCLKLSLPLKKNPNCVFLFACLLARLTV